MGRCRLVRKDAWRTWIPAAIGGMIWGFWVALSGAGAPVQAAAPEEAALFTLEQCVQVALEKSGSVLDARDSYEICLSNLRLAEPPGIVHPSITLRGNSGIQGLEGSASSAAGKAGAAAPASGANLVKSAQVEATVGDTLPTGRLFGLVSTEDSAARLQVQDAQNALRQSQQQAAVDAISAYVALAKAENAQALASQALRLAQLSLADTQVRLGQGMASQQDLLQAQKAVQQAQVDLDKATGNTATARAQLNQILGRPLGAPLEIDRNFQYHPASYDLQKLTDQAVQNRPEIQRAQTALDKGNLDLKAAVQAGKPVLSLSAGYSGTQGDLQWKAQASMSSPDWNTDWNLSLSRPWSSGDTGGLAGASGSESGTAGAAADTSGKGTAPGWQVGVAVSWTPLDGGATRERILQAQLKTQQLQRALENQKQAVYLDVLQAYNAFTAAEGALRVAQTGVDLAAQALQATQRQLQAGAATGRQADQAAYQLAQAQAAYQSALMDYILAKARLMQASAMPIHVEEL